jgi:hypothetical protein
MKRFAAVLLLTVLSFACTLPVGAQRSVTEGNARQSPKVVKQQKKLARKQVKAQRKAQKQYARAQRKANKKARRHRHH